MASHWSFESRGTKPPSLHRVKARILPAATPLVARDLFETVQKGGKILENARNQAKELLEKAESECKNIAEKAFEKGYEKGLAQATEVMGLAARQAQAMRQQSTSLLLPLATRMAERILDTELALRPEAILSVARKAMSQVRFCRKLVLKLSPEDLEVAVSQRSKLMEAVQATGEIEILPDPRIRRGGCMVETEAGEVDATLESQLEALEKALLSAKGT